MNVDRLPIGIEKIDEIINKDNNLFVFCTRFLDDNFCSYKRRYCEYLLLKNLLERGSRVGVVHMSYGNSFEKLYMHQDGWKNSTVAKEQTEEFDIKASTTVMQYPLIEFKIFGNDIKYAIDYIKSFLVDRVKYIFITNYDLDERGIKDLEELHQIAKEKDVILVVRAGYSFVKDKIPESIVRGIINFSEDKESRDLTVSCVDKNGNWVKSKTMKLITDDGLGRIE